MRFSVAFCTPRIDISRQCWKRSFRLGFFATEAETNLRHTLGRKTWLDHHFRDTIASSCFYTWGIAARKQASGGCDQSSLTLLNSIFVARFLARERVTKDSESYMSLSYTVFLTIQFWVLKKTPLYPHHAQTASETAQQSTIPAIYKHWDHWYNFKQSYCILILPTAIHIVTVTAFTCSNCAITQHTQVHSLISLCSYKTTYSSIVLFLSPSKSI